jgi:hypothetical protein
VACDPARGPAPWAGALEALGRAAGALGVRRADAQLSVSNHFIRFAVIRVAGLRGYDEHVAAARLRLREIYGERAGGWRLALSGSAGDALAAAIEQDLLDGIAATLAGANLHPTRVEPFFASAFEACRGTIGDGPVWLAAAEPGRVCVGYHDGNAWRDLRSERIRARLEDALPAVLERSRLAGGVGTAGRVLLVASDGVGAEVPAAGGWTIESIALTRH